MRLRVIRSGRRWRLEEGDTGEVLLRSPRRKDVMTAAHAIGRAFGGLLLVYDGVRVDGVFIYRQGRLEAAADGSSDPDTTK